MKETKLTVKQERFITEYIKTSCNATQAAINAGYSRKSARTAGGLNLSNPIIKERIDILLEDLKSEDIATVDEILKFHTAVMRGEEKEENLIINGEENSIVLTKPKMSVRLKAAETLAKINGMFKDNVEIENSTIKVELID